MGEYDSKRIRSLAADYAFRDGAAQQHAGRRLREAPPEEAVAALIEVLPAAHEYIAFYRVTSMLAALGGDAAEAALEEAARKPGCHARLAVRALMRCNHPRVAPALLDLLAHGTLEQRTLAAFALASPRLLSGRAVGPLCDVAANPADPIQPEARSALNLMGPPEALSRLVLADREISTPERARIIEKLAVLWTGRPSFLPLPFLCREAANRHSPIRKAAQEAADLYRRQTTLLRPARKDDAATLLRAAGSARRADRDLLLLPAEASTDAGSARMQRLWRGLLGLFRPPDPPDFRYLHLLAMKRRANRHGTS